MIIMCRIGPRIFSHGWRYLLFSRQNTIHKPGSRALLFGTVRWYQGLTSCFAKKGTNIILMGSPGAGKTTVGRMVAELLGKEVIDVDNDHLEKVWGMTVAQKLRDVGSNGFIEEEGQALLLLSCHNSVISLSGSNPMHKSAMSHIQSLGTVVYLDVEDSDILERLERMKVDRIVGQNDGTTMAEILKYRKQFYEGSYDVRILCEQNEPPKSITQKVIKSVKALDRKSHYTSTRNMKDVPENMQILDIILEGLAADGGLFVPFQEIPCLTLGEIERLVPCTYQELALRVLEKWIHPFHLHPSTLHHMIGKAYHTNFQHPGIAPVVKLEEQIFIHELFHGPTASFKDLALQLTPHFFNKAIESHSVRETKKLILVATSGDTGSAVLEGFRDNSSINVFVLYPSGGVSPTQRRQMVTSNSSNTEVLGVHGDFDFCQSAIKQIFNDTSFCEKLHSHYNVRLSAANSINWGRLVPQIVYHVFAYLQLVKQDVISVGDKADICVPTGNFGNILAAYYAKEMGIPFDNIICASNVNNVLTEFFESGIYDVTKRRLYRTMSPSIDIFKSSNLERFIYHATSRNAELVTQLFKSLERDGYFQIGSELQRTLSSAIKSGWSDEQTCLHTIKTVFNKTGYLLDTHTAIAKAVSDKYLSSHKPMVISATAHYSKFSENVLKALGKDYSSSDPLILMRELESLNARPPMHHCLEDAMKKPDVHNKVCKADVQAITEYIEVFLKNQ